MGQSVSPRLEVESIAAALDISRNSDSKLLLLVGDRPPALRASATALAAAQGWRTVDLSTALGRAFVALSANQRREQAWDLLEDVLGDRTEPVALISTDILFEPTLGYRPYEALRRLGRRGPILAAWFGRVDSGDLVRGQPGHPEYVRVRLDVPYMSVSVGKEVGA